MPLSTGGEAVKPPPGIRYCYDVESAYRYCHLMYEGEEVVATEKIHGANARFCFVPEIGMFAGSRTEWKKQSPESIWWKALAGCQALESFCRLNPDITVYGEVYGQVQDLKYGQSNGKVLVVVFDLLRDGSWLDYNEAKSVGTSLPWVPEVYRGPWNKDAIFALADGDSDLAMWQGVKQIREGIVVKQRAGQFGNWANANKDCVKRLFGKSVTFRLRFFLRPQPLPFPLKLRKMFRVET